jgi:hypothetical protein
MISKIFSRSFKRKGKNVKIDPIVLEQIELELSYAEMKYPKQKLSPEKASVIAIRKLGLNTHLDCGSCYPYKELCSREYCAVCKGYAAIAILIRALNNIPKEKLNERENYMLRVFAGRIK